MEGRREKKKRVGGNARQKIPVFLERSSGYFWKSLESQNRGYFVKCRKRSNLGVTVEKEP